MVNKEKININDYIFHHLCEAIKEIIKHKKRNVPYARLLSELFHQHHLINSLGAASAHDDLEEIHGNILSASILANMKLLKKNEVVLSNGTVIIRSSKPAYLEDYLVIIKHDNIEVVRIYIEIARKEVDVVLTYEDLLEEPTDAQNFK